MDVMRLVAVGVIGMGVVQQGAQPSGGGGRPGAAGVGSTGGGGTGGGEVKPARDDWAAEKLGWKMGTQAWTFKDRSAVEAVEAAWRLGLKDIEFYPGPRLRTAEP